MRHLLDLTTKLKPAYPMVRPRASCHVVFDRFLARVVAVLGDTVPLKGGLVLELRLERARTTKDIDLRVTGSPENILAQLQEAGRLEQVGHIIFRR
jgi:Nucleotidyl transferase AbiEii toxin, Type IV TA system